MSVELGRSDEPFVDVIVPVHEEERYIGGKIENLRALDYPSGQVAFWIVDGGSGDATRAVAVEAAGGDPRFTLLRADGADKAAQLNVALGRCRGEWILVTDADSRMAADTLRRLVREGRSTPGSGAVGVTVTPVKPHSWEELHWKVSDRVRLREAARGGASIVTGPCYLLRRELVDRFPPGVIADDVHVAFRCAAAGLRAGFIVADVAELRTPRSLRELIPHKYRKARAYVREIFRFLPLAGRMQGHAKSTFLRHAAQMILLPVLAAVLAVLAAALAARSPAAFRAEALIAAVGAGALGSRAEWRRRAALAALLTAVLFAATISLPFVRLRPSYPKVDARRPPAPETDAT